jgi:hypothetical protein
MHKFRIKYTRPNPAGVVKFDPNLEFIVALELNADSPEGAIEELQTKKPWMNVRSIEQLNWELEKK